MPDSVRHRLKLGIWAIVTAMTMLYIVYATNIISEANVLQPSIMRDLSPPIDIHSKERGDAVLNDEEITRSVMTKQENETFLNGQKRINHSPSNIIYGEVNTGNMHCEEAMEDITVVTAFFYLGETIPKGYKTRESNVYFDWMKAFELVESRVVAYFDREEDALYFQNIRHKLGLNSTKIMIVNRNRTWAFQLAEKAMLNINRSTMYPQHKDYNVLQYSCAQQVKYELLHQTSKQNPFCTKYVMWLDIGFFRDLRSKPNYPPFSLWIPPEFNESRVAYTEARPRKLDLNPKRILIDGGCWISGGAVLATMSLMQAWSEDYMAYADAIMENDVILRTDQETVYSMLNADWSSIGVQTFIGNNGEGGKWRSLGYMCKKAGITRALRENQ